MHFTRTSSIRLIKVVLSVIILLLIVGYAVWRSFDYARGPQITITEPTDWASISASTTPISGRVERAHDIYMNGMPLFIDEQGNFKETIIIFPGMNIITFTAHDQFERTVERQLRLTGI
jgi:hypothetical protein